MLATLDKRLKQASTKRLKTLFDLYLLIRCYSCSRLCFETVRFFINFLNFHFEFKFKIIKEKL